MTQYRVADIFCGAGGLSYGFEKNPHFNVAFALDIDPSAIATYRDNYPSTQAECGDIQYLKGSMLPSNIDILIGGSPCQSYTTLGKRQMDDRANLFKEYLRVLEALQPQLFLFENVTGLLSMQNHQLFKQITYEFNKLGYTLQHQVMNAVNYGVPQHRNRVIVVGTKSHIPFEFPQPLQKPHITLADAIGDLPKIKSGQDGNKLGYQYLANNEFLDFVRDSDTLTEHQSPRNSKQLIAIMEALKDGEDKFALSKELQPKTGYTNTYAKMWWNKPAPTITRNFSTPSSSRCIHPRDSRDMSIREGARLQSFPDSFVFKGTDTSKRLQIGNAVPPLLSVHLADAIAKYLTRTNANAKHTAIG